MTYPLPRLLSFLQLLIDRGWAFSTVKTYAAAISACHEGFGDRSVFSQPLTKRFLKGVRRDRPISHFLLLSGIYLWSSHSKQLYF